MELPLIFLISLFGPFLLWPVEFFLPYPYIVEEVFKFLVIYFFPTKNIKTYLATGAAFALTETVLYSININLFGNIGLFFVRLTATTLLHSLTFLIIAYLYRRNKKLAILGLLISILIHYLYNRYIPSY